MAALSDADRQRVFNALVRSWSRARDPLPGMVKTDIRAAVNAIDDWVDQNAASINNTLPAVFKANATQVQKNLLFVAVVSMRYDIDLLKRIFGEVD